MYQTEQMEDYLERVGRASRETPTNAAAMMIVNVLMIGPADLSPVLTALDRPDDFNRALEDFLASLPE